MTGHERGCCCDTCNPGYRPQACACGCEGFQLASIPPRRLVAYRRFLALDVHRAEAGRLLLHLEARHAAHGETSAPLRDPVATGWMPHRKCNDRTAREIYRDRCRLRYEATRDAMMAARWRWERLAVLAQRARAIARRLGAFGEVTT